MKLCGGHSKALHPLTKYPALYTHTRVWPSVHHPHKTIQRSGCPCARAHMDIHTSTVQYSTVHSVKCALQWVFRLIIEILTSSNWFWCAFDKWVLGVWTDEGHYSIGIENARIWTFLSMVFLVLFFLLDFNFFLACENFLAWGMRQEYIHIIWVTVNNWLVCQTSKNKYNKVNIGFIVRSPKVFTVRWLHVFLRLRLWNGCQGGESCVSVFFFLLFFVPLYYLYII